MPKPVYEKVDVTVLWNQAVHTDREVTANRPDIIIKNTKEKMYDHTSKNWSHWDSNEKLKEKKQQQQQQQQHLLSGDTISN